MNRSSNGIAQSVWQFVVDVALRWYHGRVGDLAASVTFWLLVSMPAAVLALLAALGPITRLAGFAVETEIEIQVTGFIVNLFSSSGETQDGLNETISSLFEQSRLFDQNNPLLLTFSMGLALWSLSRGFSGLIRSLEDIYDIEDRRPWYHTRVVAVLLGLGSLLLSVPFVMFDRFVLSSLSQGGFRQVIQASFALAVSILWASVLYHYGPAQRHRWRYDLPGAVVAALGWWILTVIFAKYVDLTADTNGLSAAVGAALLVLTWIWIAAQIFLVGGAVNFLFGERLGVSRGKPSWSFNDVVERTTGELKKIVVSEQSGKSKNGKGSEKNSKGEETPQKQKAVRIKGTPQVPDDAIRTVPTKTATSGAATPKTVLSEGVATASSNGGHKGPAKPQDVAELNGDQIRIVPTKTEPT